MPSSDGGARVFPLGAKSQVQFVAKRKEDSVHGAISTHVRQGYWMVSARSVGGLIEKTLHNRPFTHCRGAYAPCASRAGALTHAFFVTQQSHPMYCAGNDESAPQCLIVLRPKMDY